MANLLLEGLFSDMFNGFRSRNRFFRTQAGDPAERDGRMSRISYEFDIANDGEFVIEVVAPISFKLSLQSIEVDQGGLRFRAFRSGTVSVTGTFDTTIPRFSSAGANEVKDYTDVITFKVASGGSSLVDNGAAPAEVRRIRTSNLSQQRVSIPAAEGSDRLLAPGTYYLHFADLEGATGNCTGVYNLRVEELPDGTL